MPISRREFESGELDAGFMVMDFLRSNSDDAYTADELVELISESVDVNKEQMRDILDSLERQGKVEVRVMRGVIYYIYRKSRLGFRV